MGCRTRTVEDPVAALSVNAEFSKSEVSRHGSAPIWISMSPCSRAAR
jgi:hypothetical protein